MVFENTDGTKNHHFVIYEPCLHLFLLVRADLSPCCNILVTYVHWHHLALSTAGTMRLFLSESRRMPLSFWLKTTHLQWPRAQKPGAAGLVVLLNSLSIIYSLTITNTQTRTSGMSYWMSHTRTAALTLNTIHTSFACLRFGECTCAHPLRAKVHHKQNLGGTIAHILVPATTCTS